MHKSYSWENQKEERPLGRPRRRWMDNIEMDIEEIRLMVWCELIWLRIGVVNGSCERGNEFSGSLKCWEVVE
jgi:hypothetical protein